MKILHVIPFFAPEFGGSVNSLYNLSKYLAQNGHDVTILTTSYHFDKEYADSLSGINVISIPYFFNLGLFIYSPKIIDYLKENLRFFDIVELHNFRSYQNICVFEHAKIHSVPYCMDAYGSLLPIWDKQILKKMFDFVWGNSMLVNAACFIAATPEEKNQYQKIGVDSSKVTIIPRGIDILKYTEVNTENCFRKKYNISTNTFLILFLGRIHSIKGLDILINAFSRLSKTFENIRVVIAGQDDGYLLTLQEIIAQNNIEDKVIFTGHLLNNTKIMALKTADLVVVPSYYESFGNVVVEAMVSKTPVLISNKCGILQMFPQEIVHVCECNTDKVYDAIEKLYLNESERKKYVNSAFNFTETHFSWDNIIKKYEDLLLSIINE